MVDSTQTHLYVMVRTRVVQSGLHPINYLSVSLSDFVLMSVQNSRKHTFAVTHAFHLEFQGDYNFLFSLIR